MTKTVVSAFQNQQLAARVLDSMMSGGFDSRSFSLIDPACEDLNPFERILPEVPGLHARLYRTDLRLGESLLVAHVPDVEVAPLIKLLQSTGAHHIEAFDPVSLKKTAAHA